MKVFQCPTARGPIRAEVRIPGSKSITNRALVAAALAEGHSVLGGASPAEDTRLMIDALGRLGIAVTLDRAECNVEVTGCGGRLPADDADLFCGNSGTTLRFLSACCAVGYGRFRLDGGPRMRQRPIGPLVEALRSWGTAVEFPEREGYPPLIIHARHLRGGEVTLDGSLSSQFASALLLSAPHAANDVLLHVPAPVVSTPYLKMTVAIMDAFGASAISQFNDDGARFIVPARQPYHGRHFAIEPDASGAAYFFAAAALTGGRVAMPGLGDASVQGDLEFLTILERMGCTTERTANAVTVTGPPRGTRLRGIDVDLGDMPDVAPTLAVVALFAEGPTTLRNVSHLRWKESDRLAALQTELTRLGARIDATGDTLTVHPPPQVRGALVHTYGDHRIAMSFALAGLLAEGVAIADPDCCAKTYPGFFEQWQELIAGAVPAR